MKCNIFGFITLMYFEVISQICTKRYILKYNTHVHINTGFDSQNKFILHNCAY